MKKIILSFILISVIGMIFFVGYAKGAQRYEAIEINQKIIFNGEEQEFESPVVKINDRIYVPLRESAEKLDIFVEWYGDDEDVYLEGYFEEILDVRKKLEQLWEISLPPTAVILNYDYQIVYGDNLLLAQVLFDKKDFDDVKNQLLSSKKWYEVNSDYCSYPGLESIYSWWECPSNETMILGYQSAERGRYAKTCISDFYIIQKESGEYHLFMKLYKSGWTN